MPTSLPPPVDNTIQNKNTTNNNGKCKPGHSTELLEASVKSLRLNDKPEFRSGAGKLISMMLEARVPADNASSTPTPPVPTSSLKIKKPQPVKSIDFIDTCLPVIPIPPPLVPAKNAKSLNQHLMTHQSPSFKSLINTQLPAPQSVLVNSFEQPSLQTTTSPPLSTDIPSTDNFPTSTQTESMPERAPVVLRQRNGANKSASHARDRRSFIEKDGVQQVLDTISGGDRNRLVDGQSLDILPAGSISADGLWNGAAPVCCVCNTKIQR